MRRTKTSFELELPGVITRIDLFAIFEEIRGISTAHKQRPWAAKIFFFQFFDAKIRRSFDCDI